MKRLLRVVAVVTLTVALAYAGWYLKRQVDIVRLRVGKRPGVNVTVSTETTVITEPLRKDGYVNYLGALNLRGAEGVTPENNAAVLFWQAMGPGEIKTEMQARYFQMLKMPPPPEHGDYFVALDKDAPQFREVKDPRLSQPTADGEDPVTAQQTAAMQRPWSKDEFPLVAAWLAVNEKPLALLVSASKRPRCYHPLLCEDSDEGPLLTTTMPQLSPSRNVARALAARAMMRLKLGMLNEAWEELLACHRLARLTGQGPSLVDGLTAIAIDGIADRGDQAVLQNAHLSAAQAAKMRDDLAKLRPLPSMVDKIDVSERYMFLDCVSTASREGFDSMSTGGERKPGAVPLDRAVLAALDWDLMLRMGNSWYDRMVAAGRGPTRSERSGEFDKLDKELNALSKSRSDWKSMIATFVVGNRSEMIGNIFICLMIPAVRNCVDAEDRGVMQAELIQLGFALAAYRADHGSYPQQLTDLAPHYIPMVPVDIFANDAALHFQRQGQGYLLYSVGPNGHDDGGRGREEGVKAGESWDDLSVTVP